MHCALCPILIVTFGYDSAIIMLQKICNHPRLFSHATAGGLLDARAAIDWELSGKMKVTVRMLQLVSVSHLCLCAAVVLPLSVCLITNSASPFCCCPTDMVCLGLQVAGTVLRLWHEAKNKVLFFTQGRYGDGLVVASSPLSAFIPL